MLRSSSRQLVNRYEIYMSSIKKELRKHQSSPPVFFMVGPCWLSFFCILWSSCECCHNMWLYLLRSMLWCPLWFVLTPVTCSRTPVIFISYLCLYNSGVLYFLTIWVTWHGRHIWGQKHLTLLEHQRLIPVFGGVNIANHLTFLCYAFFLYLSSSCVLYVLCFWCFWIVILGFL